MIWRTFDGTFLSHTANLPKVRPWMGGEGEIDLRPAALDPRNVFLQHSAGGFTVMPLYEGVYECHTIFQPLTSPKVILAAILEAQEYMFARTDCEMILTKVPENNVGASWLADHSGFQYSFRRDEAWPGGVGVSYRKLPLDTWVASCSTVAEQGRAFHELIEGAKRARGSSLQAHPQDEAHDRAVGATVLMIKAGNTIKGVNHYNKWAIFAGYAQAQLLSEQPVIVDVHDAIMGMTNGQMEVLQCR